tara:strand:- start:1626 stop:1955 length:330 start_codon:yes stop_codon:yes gene_type:complete
MATRVNIVIDQGTDFETSVNLTDATGAQLDMTGMTAAAQIRKHHTSSNSTAFGTSLANTTGTLTLTLNNSVTSSLTAGRYVYDVELTDSSSKISRILEGIVTVTPEVTR